ncbi:MAG: sulfite exporter TauE/SafE family protein [Caldilineaceae bacterium]|nr:sulfite exporter TauE/SafE family protein [Caldilineaceae bacterium]
MIPDYPPLFWVTAITAVIFLGIAKAGFGGGIGVIATPLMALTISVTDAAAILLPLLIITDIFALRHYWGVYDRASIRLMLPGAVVGVAVGALVFGYFADNERALQISLGVLSLAFVAYQATRSMLLGALAQSRPPASAGVALGAAAGFTSTLAHAGGPPATIYLLPQQLPRAVFVGTSVLFFAAVNLFKLAPYGYLGLLRVGNLTTIALLAPLTYVGVRLGIFLNKRFTDRWFNRFVYTLLLLTGIQLILGENLIGIVVRELKLGG